MYTMRCECINCPDFVGFMGLLDLSFNKSTFFYRMPSMKEHMGCGCHPFMVRRLWSNTSDVSHAHNRNGQTKQIESNNRPIGINVWFIYLRLVNLCKVNISYMVRIPWFWDLFTFAWFWKPQSSHFIYTKVENTSSTCRILKGPLNLHASHVVNTASHQQLQVHISSNTNLRWKKHDLVNGKQGKKSTNWWFSAISSST